MNNHDKFSMSKYVNGLIHQTLHIYWRKLTWEKQRSSEVMWSLVDLERNLLTLLISLFFQDDQIVSNEGYQAIGLHFRYVERQPEPQQDNFCLHSLLMLCCGCFLGEVSCYRPSLIFDLWKYNHFSISGTANSIFVRGVERETWKFVLETHCLLSPVPIWTLIFFTDAMRFSLSLPHDSLSYSTAILRKKIIPFTYTKNCDPIV